MIKTTKLTKKLIKFPKNFDQKSKKEILGELSIKETDIWNEKYKEGSKPSVIKNRININLGKIVRVKFEFPKDRIRTSFEGKLQEVGYLNLNEDRRFEVVSTCSDSIEFYQKNIKRIYEVDREIWIVLKL